MNKDIDTLFSEALSSVSKGVRFLIPSPAKTLELHRAMFACICDAARDLLIKELSEKPDLAERILQEIYRVIDPEGFSECYDPSADMPASGVNVDHAVSEIVQDAETLFKRYPLFTGNDRPLFAKDDNEFMPSVETCVRSVFRFSDAETASAIDDCSNELLTRTYTLLAREKGYSDPADAERLLDAAAYDAEFTDGLCSGES